MREVISLVSFASNDTARVIAMIPTIKGVSCLKNNARKMQRSPHAKISSSFWIKRKHNRKRKYLSRRLACSFDNGYYYPFVQLATLNNIPDSFLLFALARIAKIQNRTLSTVHKRHSFHYTIRKSKQQPPSSK